MIIGVGIDIIEVDRVGGKLLAANSFRDKVFSQLEIDFCESKSNKMQHYAARFAAKEAFFKALGTGWLDGTAFNEIEITSDEKGKPSVNFIGATAETIKENPLGTIFVSMSHVKEMATAVVVIEV